MKTLTLIRHAKSSWKESMLQDMDRPLNRRGQANAAMMGERLHSLLKNNIPKKIYSSPAVRAEETAYLMSDSLRVSARAIELIPSLYTFNYEELLEWVRGLSRDEGDVFLVCHNPAITELFNILTLSNLEKIPTCGIAVLELDVVDWRQVGAGMARVKHYDFPKNNMPTNNSTPKNDSTR